MVKRFGGHKCGICSTKFDGTGSKAAAEECEALGEPKHRYSVDALVRITKGTGKGPKTYIITALGYQRRVVKKGSVVANAFHVCTYHLRDMEGKQRKGWSWLSEHRLQIVL
jgi:hypothetical protein